MNTMMSTAVVSRQRYLDQQKALLLAQAKLYSQVSHLKATLSIPGLDQETLDYTVSTLEHSSNIDLLLILGAKGQVLKNVFSAAEVYSTVLAPLLINPRDQYFLTYGQHDYLLALSPIVSGNQQVGSIVTGLRLDTPVMLNALEEITGTEVAFTHSERYFYSNNQEEKTFKNLPFNYYYSDYKRALRTQGIEKFPQSNGFTYYLKAEKLINPSSYYLLYHSDQWVRAEIFPFQRGVVFVSLMTILLSALFSWQIASNISNPVNRLITMAKNYGKGNFGMRLSEINHDEVGELTLAFNKMASDLEEEHKNLLNREQAERKMRVLAYYDPLTGLGNRRFFREELDTLIALSSRYKYALALLFLDLDGFKRINDSLGHDMGDDLLKQVCTRLQGCIRSSDKLMGGEVTPILSRLGGDEFTIILSRVEGAEDAAKVSQRIIQQLAQPYILDGHEVIVTASIGIAVTPEDGLSSDSLLKSADTAMYVAKSQGKNSFCFYDTAFNNRELEKLDLEASLRRGLLNHELKVYYQPLVDARSGEIIAAEALVRWQHPEKGLLGPDVFIQLAEDIGEICTLGQQVLFTACSQLKQWRDEGLSLEYVSVNFSAKQFHQSDINKEILQTLVDTGVQPSDLLVEITESALINHQQDALKKLEAIKQSGIRIAIDDFGTGYSSLSYLRNLPIHVLKIDREFVSEALENKTSLAIIETIIALANNLNLKVIAEGVETEAQSQLLRHHKIDCLQGYLFSRPVSAVEFAKLMRVKVRLN